MEYSLLVAKEPFFFNFSRIENTLFSEPKSWWKHDIYWLLKGSCFELFENGKYGLFLRQKVSEKMIFTDYWHVLVLNFLGTENTVFFWGKKLMERWYLLVIEKFLFWAFSWWEIWSFLMQKVNGKMIFRDYWKVLVLGYRKVLVLSFSVMGNTLLFLAKKLI